NDLRLANSLNEYYCRFERQWNSPDPPQSSPHQLLISSNSSSYTSIPVSPTQLHTLATPHLPPLTPLTIKEEEVNRLFKRLNTHKATGLDSVSPSLLKHCANQLSPVFTDIFNTSLETCHVPACFKTSAIVPVPKKTKITGLNDYRPVALTSVVMKSFEHLVLSYLKDITDPLLDPLLFAYRANRSVDDAVNMALHFILQHLDSPGSYARILFVDFSSAFNTIIPALLRDKLFQLNVPDSMCSWITDFLTDRRQFVRLGTHVSDLQHISTGSPQGCVLSPLLFSLYTNGCTSGHQSVKLLKFADDTTLIGLISDGDELAYRGEIDRLVSWCNTNNLELNSLKTVEMTVDFRKNPAPHTPVILCDSLVSSAESFCFLGTTITKELKWEQNIRSLTKKAQQRMYFLRQLKKFLLPVKMLVNFYTAIIESVLTSSITVWFAAATARDKAKLQHVILSTEKVIGCSLPSLQELYVSRSRRRAAKIAADPSHPGNDLFRSLPSGKRHRSFRTRTSRHKNNFFPTAVSLLNNVSSNLIYPPLLSQSQTVVVGGLWNCQSAVRKADFISVLASHYSFDFLALTETWISPQNTATPAALSSAYTFSHSPRVSGRGGGTVSVTSPINLFIIVIYRLPGPLGNFLDEMDTLLSVFSSDSTPLTVLGDFNLPSDKLHSSGLLALLNSFSLSFNSCPPTHKKGNVLDLVFTHPSPATDMTVTPLHISDHHLVSFTITLPVLPKRNSQHLSLTRRNLHSISPSSVASCTLSSPPDHESFSSLPLDSATDTLLSSLSSTLDLLCPLSTIRKKNSSTAPWLSDVLHNNQRQLRSAARKWKKSKLDTDLISYRTLLSKFSLDVTSAKTYFYKEKLETSAQDPRKLHNIFSSLLNPTAPPSPSSLTAEDFATFFTEKIERICQTFTSLPTSPTSHSQHSATPSLTQLSTVASEEVLQITRSCNPTTCPLDPIPSAMLQTISPDLLPFITTVINRSLTSGHVPTAFKKARVIPILKKPALDPSDISNYRPVSLLSFLSKILERVVCNQLSDYLMQNNLHDPNQSGFKAAHSTETALLALTEKLHAARSAKLSSVLILLDLSAAFDTVNHKTLLSTLRSLGIVEQHGNGLLPTWMVAHIG
ncbi:hypothetical protein QTP70_011851, partial [Hemibagrus guttatus]